MALTDVPVARAFDSAWGYDHLVQADGRIVVTGVVQLWQPLVDYAGIPKPRTCSSSSSRPATNEPP